MRPFFSYFGSKWRLSSLGLYPRPQGKVFEPFAGSAGYATFHEPYRAVLYDVDPRICGVWDYLINSGRQEILKLPDLEPGESVSDLELSQEAKWLIGFWIGRARVRPALVAGSWARRFQFSMEWGPNVRQRIVDQKPKIAAWSIYNKRFDQAPNTRSTWFIDPPYYPNGKLVGYDYRLTVEDFARLRTYCLDRNGLTIVCERFGANWLPFEKLVYHQGVRKPSIEAVWIKEVV